jgi:hypothetical protein
MLRPQGRLRAYYFSFVPGHMLTYDEVSSVSVIVTSCVIEEADSQGHSFLK